MDDVLPKINETQPQIENGRRRHAATKHTNSAIFQELEKGDVIAMKGYVTNGQPIAGDTVWYVTASAANKMSRQLFETRRTRFSLGFDTSAPQPNQKDHKKTTARLF